VRELVTENDNAGLVCIDTWLRVVTRGFEPARDAQGNPVSSLFRTSIIFINYKWS